MPSDGILPYIFANSLKRLAIQNPYFRESSLPNRSAELKIFSGTKCEPTFDELNGLLNADSRADGNQNMKVIRHHNKLVQTIFSLRAIVVQNANE